VDSFSYVKKGYSPEEVDKYISTLEEVIKSYKDKDNAIKNAIISAQIAADNVVKNAQMQAEDYKMKIVRQLDAVKVSIDKQRMRLQAFHDVYNGLLRKYLREIDDADMTDLFGKLDEVENMINALAGDDFVPDETAGG
jgi:cell division septum initiation protein DivIVA